MRLLGVLSCLARERLRNRVFCVSRRAVPVEILRGRFGGRKSWFVFCTFGGPGVLVR